MKNSTIKKRIFAGAISPIALGALVLLGAGCGPEPGTPEYVLAKMKEGLVVGAQNLDLLGPEHTEELLGVVLDGGQPRIARMQALDRLIQVGPEKVDERFGELLSSDDPDIRIRMVRRFAERRDELPVELLVERLDAESSLAVRRILVHTLQRIGAGRADPPEELVAGMIRRAREGKDERRRDWIRVLGGWHGEAVERFLAEALEDEDARIAAAAASSLQGPAVRDIGRMGPVYVSLLHHDFTPIREAAIAGLEAATHPKRMGGGPNECAEKPVLALVQSVPELEEAIESYRERRDLSDKELQLSERIEGCLDEFVAQEPPEGATEDPPAQAAPSPGPPREG